MNIYDAIASVIYFARKQAVTLTGDNERICASGLYEDWSAGKYQTGDIRNADGQTWDGTSHNTASPFVPVQGAHDMYHSGGYMVYTDEKTYKCVQNTNFSPEDYAQAWEVVK